MDGDTTALEGLGFTRVYGDFVEVDTVVAALREDLVGHRPRLTGRMTLPGRRAEPKIEGRDAVLGQWPTGEAARSIEENAAVLAQRPSLAELHGASPRPLLQPRSGVRGQGDQQRLFAELHGAGADVLSFQVDSLTRDGRYAEAQRAMSDRGDLNGFPVVNHGVDALRQISAACPVPLQTRHSARDPRLLAELSYAGGVTAFEGGPICYNIPYYAELPLAVSIDRWRYVDRLTGRYADLGVVLDREFFGTLTATLLPPCVAITTNLLEGMLAVEAGVRSVSLAYAEQGCRSQDVAAVRVMGALARELLATGRDVHVATVFHQYMGAFPRHPDDAEQLILASAETAALAGADRIVVKTACEALRIPGVEDNMRALALAGRGVDGAARAAHLWDTEEAARIEASVRSLLQAVLALAPGDTGACVEQAFALGYLDIPFSPSRFNAGRMVAARDLTGAVRILEPGDMPLPQDVLAFEADRLNERLAVAGVSRSEAWRLVADDVLRTNRRRTSWPLDRAARSERAVG
ncbi:methylaspartate mutase subunit E [Streptomyces sp. col6]|uniref:methylaspartate mutase subunit E n=1 Tax=Streptomyces sp. col6 TaxID=2478958 RepID=UPI001746F26D|nr:methylaspartate mutase subunit E [Streptomyces sp. col6]